MRRERERSSVLAVRFTAAKIYPPYNMPHQALSLNPSADNRSSKAPKYLGPPCVTPTLPPSCVCIASPLSKPLWSVGRTPEIITLSASFSLNVTRRRKTNSHIYIYKLKVMRAFSFSVGRPPSYASEKTGQKRRNG